MAGGTIRYVPLSPPRDGATKTTSAGEWSVDFEELERAVNGKTKMIVRNSMIFLKSFQEKKSAIKANHHA